MYSCRAIYDSCAATTLRMLQLSDAVQFDCLSFARVTLAHNGGIGCRSTALHVFCFSSHFFAHKQWELLLLDSLASASIVSHEGGTGRHSHGLAHHALR